MNLLSQMYATLEPPVPPRRFSCSWRREMSRIKETVVEIEVGRVRGAQRVEARLFTFQGPQSSPGFESNGTLWPRMKHTIRPR